MEFIIFIVIVIIMGMIGEWYDNFKKNSTSESQTTDKSSTTSSLNHSYFYDRYNDGCICEDEEEEEYYDYYDDESKQYHIKYSAQALADALVRKTGYKRVAKDILVKRYGLSESKAKRLVGYRGY